MAEIAALAGAVAALVHNGDGVALEGFIHLIPAISLGASGVRMLHA